MFNKALVARTLKKALIYLRMDNTIANIYASFPLRVFFKAIPTSDYYLHTQIKQVKRYGVNFSIYPADYSQWTIFSNQIDSHLFVAKKLIGHHKQGVILDIGSNCGIFGLIMAKYFCEKRIDKKVLCYEPNPRVFALLTANLEQNQKLRNSVFLYNKALGNQAGYLEMQIPLRNSGAGSILRNYQSEPHDKVDIEISTADIELLKRNETVDFIKIDVENYEYFVLDGARKIIQKDRPVIYFEVGPGQVQQKEMFELLSSLGYQFFLIRGQRFVNFSIDDQTDPWFKALDNITAIHSEFARSIDLP